MTATTRSLPIDVHGYGVLASRPAAGVAGREYHATDGSGTRYRDNGTSWDTLSFGAGGGSALTVREVDGSPSDAAVTELVFPNGTLGIASHVATYTPAAGGGGALVLLEQHPAAASASLDFTAWRNDSLYDEYEIHLIDLLPAVNADNLWLRVSTNGGSSYAATNYAGALHYAYPGGTGISGATSTLAHQISDSVGNTAAGGGWNGRVYFANPGSATYKRFLSRGQMYHGSIANTMVFTEVMGMWNTTTAIDAFRILYSGGNITSGAARIYGIAK